MTAALLALSLAAPAAAAVPWGGITVSPRAPVQGEVVRVLFDKLPKPSEFSVVLDGRETPVYRISKSQARALVPTTPNTKTGEQFLRITRQGVLNKDSWRIKIQVAKGSYREKHLDIDKEPADADKAEMKAAKARMVRALELKTQKQLWRGSWLRPVPGRQTGVYGNRRVYNGDPSESFHRGADYAGKKGARVAAVNSGKVVYAEKAAFEGNSVVVDHGHGVLSLYIHLDRILVGKGDLVAEGEAVGTVGMSGRATGPHLHFGIYVDGAAVDPAPFLKREF